MSAGEKFTGDQSSKVPPESVGENELARPLPADESPERDQQDELLTVMEQTIDRLRNDDTSVGDLKILSRTLRELRYALKVFAPYRRRRKITVFGSARTKPDAPAYIQGVELGKQMASHGWMLITGAGGGIMEAGHRGAGRELSMGLNIKLPFEQSANPYIDGDPKLVTLRYFFTRKLMFVKECSAVCCLPGGFGTLDETLEVLTLLQTGKQQMLPLVLLDQPGGTFWKTFHEFVIKDLLANKLISPEDLSLYLITDRVEEAVKCILHFYSNYHSMRYVRELLVLRLLRPLPPEMLARLNRDFADIIVSGEMQLRDALPEEDGEPELAELPRLVFHFERVHIGRLRQLIDELNRV
ncbi:MAG: LOG family protein [Planctomycetes bacterium]|nr:LOG family protein [Planctomycetota bacterium]